MPTLAILAAQAGWIVITADEPGALCRIGHDLRGQCFSGLLVARELDQRQRLQIGVVVETQLGSIVEKRRLPGACVVPSKSPTVLSYSTGFSRRMVTRPGSPGPDSVGFVASLDPGVG